MTSKTYICEYLPRYLDKYLPISMNLTDAGYKSYVTSLWMLLEHASKTLNCPSHKIKARALDYKLLYDFMIEKSEKKSWKQATWNARLSGLKAFLGFLSMEDPWFLEVYNRFQKIKCQRRDRSDPFYLTKEQVEKALDSFTPRSWIQYRDYTMIKFMIKTGLRAFEVRKLTHDDIVFFSSHSAQVNFKGKGRKNRGVPIRDHNMIKNLSHFLSLNDVKTKFCFPSRSGTKMSESNLANRVTHFFQPYDVSKKVTPHDLRRSAAMLWLRKGADIETISALLGHEDISTTERYVRFILADLEAELERIALDAKDFQAPKLLKKDSELLESIKERVRKNRKLAPI